MSLSTRYFIPLALFISLLAASIFLPGLNGGFVLDDGINILQNRLLYINELNIENLVNAALSFHDGNGSRPLPMASFAADHWRANGMDASTFKTTNLLIHLFTTFFLTLFIRQLLLLADWNIKRATIGALLLALFWAIHPLQVSSVMYIVQRMQTMATMFIVLALWAYIAMRKSQLDGGRGRLYGVIVLFFWGLALACKEDAALLPAYTLALELTILRFRAAQKAVAKGLRQSYLLMCIVGAATYFFVVVPYYWQWEVYPGRDFSSMERLLTQGRVLAMHLGQTVFPLPDRMPFIYDTLTISRDLWQPWTTLPSLLLLAFLIAWAWRWRTHRPLFSLGVLLFFFGHFISSNVIGLELVFEHRNHFPLIGVMLALGDLFVLVCQRWQWSPRLIGCVLSTVIALLGLATISHAYTWGDPVRHGKKMVELQPASTRAWTQLGGAYFDLYRRTADDKYLSKAIDVNTAGLEHIASPSLAGNLVIYKSLLGTVSDKDWQVFLDILNNAQPSWQTKFVVWVMMKNANHGFAIDKVRIVEALHILSKKNMMTAHEYMEAGVFIYKTSQQREALTFFEKAMKLYPAPPPVMQRLLKDLVDAGHTDWVETLQKIHE